MYSSQDFIILVNWVNQTQFLWRINSSSFLVTRTSISQYNWHPFDPPRLLMIVTNWLANSTH